MLWGVPDIIAPYFTDKNMTVHIEYSGFPSEDLGTEMEVLVTAATEAGLNSCITKREDRDGQAVIWDPRWIDTQSAATEEQWFMERWMHCVGFGDESIVAESGKQYVHIDPVDGRSTFALHTPEGTIAAGVCANILNPLRKFWNP